MARTTGSWMRFAAVAALASQTIAQQCYYPNGSQAPSSEKPCSSAQGSACCPDTWECLDNGLCHLPSGNLYGVYSCTDKTWKSSGCASNICTYGNTRPGGESIAQCSNHNNQWCCNGDNVNVKCCQESPAPRPFYSLQDGKAYATVGSNQASTNPNLASITMLVSGSSSSSPTQSSAAGSTAGASTTPRPSSSSVRPVTSELTSVSSGSAGVQTIIQTLVVTPTSNPTTTSSGSDSSSSGSSKPNIGLIVGCAVGIPLALALLGIVFWMLRKRRQQTANPYDKTDSVNGADSPNSPGFAGGAAAAKLGKKDQYRHSRPGTTEIDGAPAGPGRPISTLPGRAELESGHGFQPGHNPYGPDTVGIGGGNGDGRSTWGSAPPGYSPGPNQAAFSHNSGAAELDGTSALPVISEKPQQQYEAYRPSQPVAELPTVKTPPEDLEKQIGK